MTNKETAKLLRSAASAIEHGRRATFNKKVAQLFTDDERDAFLSVVDRALDDLDNYMLSANGERDYGKEYGEVLEQNAKDFDAITALCQKLGLPGSYQTVSTNFRQAAVEWAEQSQEEKAYGSQLSEENSVRG